MKYIYLIVLSIGFLLVFFTMGKIQEKTVKASNSYAKYLIEQGY